MVQSGNIQKSIHMYGYTPVFSANFSKVDGFCDFLFAPLGEEDPYINGLLLKEIVCPFRSQFFL